MNNERAPLVDLAGIRSILFTPADKPLLVTKASRGRADAVCLDLEDSIPLASKSAARNNIEPCSQVLASQHKSVWIRVNSEAELLSHDLDVIPTSCAIILLPKARSIDHVEMLCEAIDRRFSRGTEGPSVVAMVESTAGIQSLQMHSSRYVHPRWAGLSMGTEDLASELACDPGSPLIAHTFNQLVLCSINLNLPFFGYPASIAEFTDIERFSSGVEMGQSVGAAGGFCIHPAQIDTLNSIFSPSEEKLDWATSVVHAFENATGEGSIAVGGKMVDRPVYLRAQQILQGCGLIKR